MESVIEKGVQKMKGHHKGQSQKQLLAAVKQDGQKTDTIDHTAGIVLHFTLGDYIEKGAPIATLYTSTRPEAFNEVGADLLSRIRFESQKTTELPPLIYKIITGENK